MTKAVVKKRAFLSIAGYEPISANGRHKRFILESKQFEKTWNAAVAVSPISLSEDGAIASWKIDSHGPNWRTETDYRVLCWDDFVVADLRRSALERMPKGFAALADFIFSGTAWRYFRVSVRYGFFFLCPVLVIIASMALAVIASVVTNYFVPGGLPAYVALPFALGTFIFLIFVSGRFLYFNYMLDDWIFADEFVHRKRRALDERLDRFAREIANCGGDGGYDEVVIFAHSLGGALVIDALDRALKSDPLLGTRGTPLWLMAAGSSLLKVALHPKASWLRSAVKRVAEAPGINWVEYQTVVDVISFYRVDPVVAMGLPKGRNPVVQNVRMREMLTPVTYHRLRGNFFRLHRQWTMGNEVRYFYDYFQACCGPASLGRRVGDHYIADYFREDGSYNAESGPEDAIRKRQLIRHH